IRSNGVDLLAGDRIDSDPTGLFSRRAWVMNIGLDLRLNDTRTMETVDVAIVIGANDVVNPSSRTDENSPIYQMPIIDVDKARSVIVIKRSLSPGFAGIPNPLFAMENTSMLFGDGKQMMLDITAAIQDS
ncbi:MAG: NAD(P)(+) transhydrogenase (Re/Si-specific) subunit beta, partial [Pirellulaceae bacterium]|nr:NAD(P)(+) transhydrogenase (Re/Si-specific) subunit beta [Pirellulaceae bacterium]